MRGRRRRNLFSVSLVAGGALGVIVPLIVDGSLRLAGIGLPAGLILGMIVYVTADLLLSGQGEIQDGPGGASGQTSGRRQLLILVLFAAIVAHFVEVHFGIAIASTLTLFWVLAGALVPVGMGWVENEEQVEAEVEARKVEAGAVALKAQPGGVKVQPSRRFLGQTQDDQGYASPGRAPAAGIASYQARSRFPAGTPARPSVAAPALRRDRRPDHARAHLGFHPHGCSHRRDHPWRLPLGCLHQPVERGRLYRRSLADAAGDDDLHLADRRGVGRGRKRATPAVGRRAGDLSRCNGRHVADLRSGRVEPDDTRGPERSGCISLYRRTRGAV